MGAPKGLVLDLGCNNGEGMAALRARWPDAELLGLEPHKALAAQARQRGFTVDGSSAEEMSFGSGVMDWVISRHSLEHVPNLAKACAEIARVLKSGGKVYVQAPIEPNGSKNKLHVSAFRAVDEVRGLFPGFVELYWAAQETVVELIAEKPRGA
ncbi:MAG: class I SAM-dependent methyltransferase [Planctomycetes bacterium]|nr:class I SAM-dependent methyltransferase [Planctomycetota bacterium]